ncbi:hypothetical protein CspHIS471_0402340 [Cutaneotrichosporon sp. HIS471]|nr:hypothetical protein CspHIS471_0402340 [Cutaneotrichosporon sp. HIS471]
MKALLILWATTVSALLVNVTLSPLDTAFTYAPDLASKNHWSDSQDNDGKVIRTGAAESDTVGVALSLPGMKAVTLYGEASAPGSALLQVGTGESESVIPMGPFAFSYTWAAAGPNTLRLSLSGLGAKMSVHRAEVALGVVANATSVESLPIRTEPFGDTNLNSFYIFQGGFKLGSGLVPVGSWEMAKGPNGEAAAIAPPMGRALLNIPSNTSLAVLSAWSTKSATIPHLELAPAAPWMMDGLIPMSLFSESDGLVRWHVVLDPTVRYGLRLILPSFDVKETSVKFRDMAFWGATE